MKLKKKIISILLVVAMLIANCNNMIIAFAKDNGIQENLFTTNEDIAVEGMNSFGTLLADEIETGIDEQEENNGCNIFSIEMIDNVAIVSFETKEYATLVVGIYDETGDAMLATGKLEVAPGETSAYVEIDIDSMPEYFYLRGFLIEEDSMRPLCTSYESPNYTQEMQEFLAKTTDDFDAEKVLNLDDDKTNNFAVYSDDTIIIPESTENNQVAEVNEENHTYVIENIDEYIETLQVGDIFAYEYGDGNILIVKIAAISIDGTTATITGEETSLDEVFDYVKIDETSYTQDVSVDESNCEDGVVYEGDVEVEDEVNTDTPQVFGLEYEENTSASFAKKFSFLDKELNGGTKLSGSLEFQVEANLKLYISLSSQYVEVKLNYKANVTLSLSGKTEECNIPLAYFEVCPIPGVFIKFTPSLVTEVSAKLNVSGQLYGTVGFSASAQDGMKNLTTTPQFKAEVKGEFTVFVGLSMEPKVTILSDNIAEAKLIAKVGAEAKGTLSYSADTSSKSSPNKLHECTSCVDGDIKAKISISFEAKLLNLKNLTFKLSETYSLKFADFYMSFDYGEFDFTSCPHYLYKTTFTLYDAKGKALENATIKLTDTQFTVIAENGTKEKVSELKANSDGRAEGYLPSGTYYATADVSGYMAACKKITIQNEARSFLAYLKELSDDSENEDLDSGDDGISNDGGNSDTENGGSNEVSNIVKELSLGNGYSGAITENGNLYMWGDNSSGQIGNGSKEEQLTSVKVLENVIAVSLGERHSGAVTEDGSLYMWGDNSNGQVGNGSEDNQLTPVKVLDNVVSVSLGGWHSGAVTKDGSLYMWGKNSSGQVGNGSEEDQLTPIKVLDNVISVSLGDRHSGAITEDGSLYMWGSSAWGQALNETKVYQLTPIKVLDNVVSVSLGGEHSGAITKDGSLYMWGRDWCAQLGNELGLTYSDIPIKVLDNVASVSLGYCHSGAITEDGSLYMWGCRNYGKVGNGSEWDQNTPEKVLDNVVSVSLGYEHSGAITKDGSLYMWGSNDCGQLGNGNDENQFTPVKVLLNSSAQQIDESQDITPLSLYGAVAYSTEIIQEASFTDLIPNETYNFYVMKDKDVSDVFASSNLLYLSQVVSDDEGNINISYRPTEQVDNADIFVVQMKQTDLSLAQVELENLTYIGTTQYVNPVVTLDGNTLQEGKDYELLGDYSALDAGNYTVIVHGIGLYAGKVSVEYEVLNTTEEDFTDLIQKIKDADEATIVTAEMKSTTLLPKEVLDALQGKNVTLELTLNNEVKWSINGTELSSEQWNDINLSVLKTGKEDGNISVDAITSIAGTRDAEQLIFRQNSSFDFIGELILVMKDGINVEKGVLLQSIDGELKLADSSLILNNTITFDVEQGADSVIVYGTNGDINGDGTVTIKDMMQILHYVSNRNSLDELQKGFADVDMSDSINIQDLMRELHYVSGRSDFVYKSK